MDVSELFPHVARHVDDLCLIRSMCCDSFFHAQGTLEMMTGSGLFLRPSFGSWLTYGLGTENRNLPGFVVLGTVMGTRRYDQSIQLGFLAGGVPGDAAGEPERPDPQLEVGAGAQPSSGPRSM